MRGHGREHAARLPRCPPVRSPQRNMLAVLDALGHRPADDPRARPPHRAPAGDGAPRGRAAARVGRAGARPGRRAPGPAAVRARPARARSGRACARPALPFMGDLYAATHEVVALAVLDGTDTVWLEQLAGRLAPPGRRASAAASPAHVTAAGKALLAFVPAVGRRALRARSRAPRPGHDHRSRRAAEPRLAEIRERGVAINREESRPRRARRRRSRDRRDGTLVAALALAVARRSRSWPEAMAPAVRTAALALGRTLST